MTKAVKASCQHFGRRKANVFQWMCTPGSTGAEVQQTEFLGLTNKQTNNNNKNCIV